MHNIGNALNGISLWAALKLACRDKKKMEKMNLVKPLYSYYYEYNNISWYKRKNVEFKTLSY